jgi:hypothetical protein
MPNWCQNKLTVSHDDPSMLDRFVQAYNAGKVCNEFIPKPDDIGDGWFDWCIKNWGTKWDVGADIGTDHEERYGLKATVVDNEANCSFDSAWSPPIGLYEKLDELGYKVHASYFEGGMCFCGIWVDGYDNYIEYKTKDEIPVGVWNDFNLDEYFTEEAQA